MLTVPEQIALAQKVAELSTVRELAYAMYRRVVKMVPYNTKKALDEYGEQLRDIDSSTYANILNVLLDLMNTAKDEDTLKKSLLMHDILMGKQHTKSIFRGLPKDSLLFLEYTKLLMAERDRQQEEQYLSIMVNGENKTSARGYESYLQSMVRDVTVLFKSVLHGADDAENAVALTDEDRLKMLKNCLSASLKLARVCMTLNAELRPDQVEEIEAEPPF